MTTLRGITWDHPRGIDPLRAAGIAYSRIAPGTVIDWTARSLHEFEALPLAALARDYDLLAIDHPFVGSAVEAGALRPLDDLFTAEDLAERASDSVGVSHASYRWDGRQWGVAVDAACMVGAVRRDLIQGDSVPATWDEALRLAGAHGRDRVLLAANPTHLWGVLLSLCEAVSSVPARLEDGRPAWWDDEGIDRPTLLAALELLEAVLAVCSPDSLHTDPIVALERLGGDDEILYVPLVFGYVTYARPATSRHVIEFVDAPGSDGKSRGTLTGGVGLALSAYSAHAEEVAGFLRYVTGRDIQRTLFTSAGGQPARRSAWLDEKSNSDANDFFTGTLQTMSHSFLRPRHAFYPQLQVESARCLHDLVLAGSNPAAIADSLRGLWNESRRAG